MIGLEEVKNVLRGLHAKIKINIRRKELGLPTVEGSAMHMVYTGNPGTGKTTVARIVGNLLFDLNIIQKNKVIEVDRSDLVAGYVGQTAMKTQAVIKSALGGVLFIDEAYTLVSDQDSKSSFGTEAIDTLLKAMEDNRENLVVIFAGYQAEMEGFLNSNPGLRSRIPYIIEFNDYSDADLIRIFEGMLQESQYIVSEFVLEKVKEQIIIGKKEPQFSNGRFVRNLYEDIIRNQALRLEKIMMEGFTLTKEDLMRIDIEDIK